MILQNYYILSQNYNRFEIRNPQSKIKVAERVGFEPTEPVKAQQFSRLPDSTTLAPLHFISVVFA